MRSKVTSVRRWNLLGFLHEAGGLEQEGGGVWRGGGVSRIDPHVAVSE